MNTVRVAALLAFSTLAGCQPAPVAVGKVTGAPPFRTVVTVGMLADLVREIGGERLAVDVLMGPGTDPHLYTATPGDRRKLLEAKLIFYCGHHLEGKMVEVLESMSRKVPSIAACERIPAERLHRADGAGSAFDPHLWFDVSLWAQVAEVVRDALVEVDPAGADRYLARANTLLERLRALDADVRTRLASIPKERRVLITAHDAFGYLGAAYDVEVVGIQGISTESEAAVGRMQELVELITSRKVPAVFVESTISEKNIRSLVEGCQARGHELRIGGSLYSDAMGAAGTEAGTYIGMVRHNVNTIVEALK